MSQAGRPERPINAAADPLRRLAGELRRLRGERTYRELAAKTGLSIATLQNAAAGKTVPTWRVTCAFAAGCGRDAGPVRGLWEDALAATGRPVPDATPPAHPPIPRPGEVTSAAQFLGLMKLLRQWAGNPSLAELNRRSGGFLLPPSTLSDALAKDQLPRLDLILSYVRACGLNDEQATAWERTWRALRTHQRPPHEPPPGNRPRQRPPASNPAPAPSRQQTDLRPTPEPVPSQQPSDQTPNPLRSGPPRLKWLG